MIAWLSLLLITLAIFVVSALPLFFAVKMLGGRTSIIKIIIINVLVALVSFIINFFFHTWGGLLAFILMIWMYKEFFRLGFIRAILAWLLQFVFAVLIVILLGLVGVSLLIF